jgi:hypothetical protein
MRKISIILVAFFILVSVSAKAQYDQNRSGWERMFKVDLGYAPFVTNPNDKENDGYYLNNLQHFGGVNVMGGLCLNQDFFAGLGAGFNYYFVPNELGKDMGNDRMGFQVYGDFDYRSLQDEFSPMVYAKAGASYMMSDGTFGNTLTPMLEVGLGCNWYFSHAVVNMERNYKSLYLTVGFAYMQQTFFLPICLGIRF